MEILKVLHAGMGGSVQDRGRVGWRKFGVPAGGVMDDHAADWANRLLDNPPGAPVVEVLLQGARLQLLQDTWLAVTGADATASIPTWRAVRVRQGDCLEFWHNGPGVWSYVAIENGWAAPQLMGSAGANPRAGFGLIFRPDLILRRRPGRPFHLPEGVASRAVPRLEQRNYQSPPVLRVWPAPQTGEVSDWARHAFFHQIWTVSAQSDRVGYRLLGQPLPCAPALLLSEPVRVGTIQLPESGLPIVTLRDGPTVGGYAKLGVLQDTDVSWLTQCRPGQTVRFRPVTEDADERGPQL
jgi:biotin-dependent carboxylase-like uncharacterized protein